MGSIKARASIGSNTGDKIAPNPPRTNKNAAIDNRAFNIVNTSICSNDLIAVPNTVNENANDININDTTLALTNSATETNDINFKKPNTIPSITAVATSP